MEKITRVTNYNPMAIPFSKHIGILKSFFIKKDSEKISYLERCKEGLLNAIDFNEVQRGNK
jgi:hypothetical protein